MSSKSTTTYLERIYFYYYFDDSTQIRCWCFAYTYYIGYMMNITVAQPVAVAQPVL